MKMDKVVADNVIIGEFITDLFDPQYQSHAHFSNGVESLAKNLKHSAAYYQLPVYILSNGLEEDYVDENAHYVNMDVDANRYDVSIYFIRWEMALDFLVKHPEIKKVALVDFSDVEVYNYPFDRVEDGILYFGDELKSIGGGIVKGDKKPDFMERFFIENSQLQMLNPVVIVGTRAVIMEFLTILVEIFTRAQVQKMRQIPKSAFGDYEMALVNYVAYRYFKRRLKHGREVSTKFNYWEPVSSAWFKHK